MIGIGLLTLALATLVATAPASDKIDKIPVSSIAFRDTQLTTTPASTQDILMSNLRIEPFITSLLNPSKDLTIMTQ